MVIKSSDTPVTNFAMLCSCRSDFHILKKKQKKTLYKKKRSMLIDKGC